MQFDALTHQRDRSPGMSPVSHVNIHETHGRYVEAVCATVPKEVSTYLDAALVVRSS